MIELIFNMIGSEVHNNIQWSSYAKESNRKENSDDYFNFELFCAKPVIEWCRQQHLDFEIEDAHYAMQLAFIFKDETDAMAFKLRWL